MQPIAGYNYGARNFRRVKETYLKTIVIGLAVGVVGWACFQLFTQSIVNLFGQESELYNQFALKCFHIFLSAIFLTGFIIPSGIFFQSIGKPTKAMICTLTRQLIFLVPAIFILPHFFDDPLEGLWHAAPAADALASVLAITLLIIYVRKLQRGDVKQI